MNSMTGFGRGTAAVEGIQITLELNSVNKRSLETAFSLPKEWCSLESAIAEKLKMAFQRGRIQAWLQYEAAGEKARGLAFDRAGVMQTLTELSELADIAGIVFSPSADVFWQIAYQNRKTAELPKAEAVEAPVLEALAAAIGQMAAMRATEGAALQRDLSARINTLERLTTDIAKAREGLTQLYREALLQRLKQLNLELDLNDERVLKEVSIFADRCDVTEELTRLASHLQQFREALQDTQPVGRKLEFLVQEIHREFNTVGSKANQLETSKYVIEAKNEIERIREQVQNVE